MCHRRSDRRSPAGFPYQELAAAGPPFTDYAAALKQRGGLRWPAALRRLAQLRRDYPAVQLTAAIRTAAHYGLYDLDRLERMILKQVATDFFVLPVDRAAPSATPDDRAAAEVSDEG